MVKSGIIFNEIEKFAPLCYASNWDNVGLMIGSVNADINKVMVCLDVTLDVVKQAISNNCELIISHHPLLFKDLKIIDFETPKGEMIKDIIKNNITVYSCHTNMDSANGGINTMLAEIFSLTKVEVLENNEYYPSIGIGRLGELEKEISFAELCNITKTLLNTNFLKVVPNNGNFIKKLCVASGSCGDLIQLAANKGADAIITADVKYHEAMDAKDSGIAVIDAGHYPTEIIVCDIFKSILKNLDIEVITAKSEDVFKMV